MPWFLKGASNYGMPSRVRSDQGRENIGGAILMIEYRGAGSGTMLTGKRGFSGMCFRVFLHSVTKFSVTNFFFHG